VRYLYSRGVWESSPRLQNLLGSCGDVVFVLSVIAAVAAVIGLKKDESLTYRLVALLLSVFSVAFYVR
jgi:hypothetical protein